MHTPNEARVLDCPPICRDSVLIAQHRPAVRYSSADLQDMVLNTDPDREGLSDHGKKTVVRRLVSTFA
jgi:hypothetical protein